MLSLLRYRLTQRTAGTFACELLLLNLCLTGYLYLRGFLTQSWDASLSTFVFALGGAVIVQAAFWSFGLYSRRVVYCGARVFQHMLSALVFTALLLFPFVYLFSLSENPLFALSLRGYISMLAMLVLAVTAERYLVFKLCGDGNPLGNVLLLGNGECAGEIIREARNQQAKRVDLVGILGCHEDPDTLEPSIEGVDVVGTVGEIEERVSEYNVKTVLLSMPYDYPNLPLDFLLRCRAEGLNVYDATTFYESLGQKVLLERFDPFSVLFPRGFRMTRIRARLKETIERTLAFVLLLVTLVPMLLIATIIRLTSSGPILARRQRVGQGEAVFSLYRFNTANSPRGSGKTPFGGFLSRTRLDRLPQLINILRGDLAFVGPSPERPDFVKGLGSQLPFYQHRHFVKPGWTGWAQVSCPHKPEPASWKEQLRYDLYYVKNMSISFDMIILLAATRALFTGKGFH